jgi:hypothetical protein
MPRIVVVPPSHFLYPQTRLHVENDPDRLLSRVGGRMIGMGVTPGFDRGAVAINARQTVTLGRFKGSQNIGSGGIPRRVFQLAVFYHAFPLAASLRFDGDPAFRHMLTTVLARGLPNFRACAWNLRLRQCWRSMENGEAVERAAREAIDQHGDDAAAILRERAELADHIGDLLAAAAERMLRS